MPFFLRLHTVFLCLLAVSLTQGVRADEQEITSITVLADRALSLPLTQLASNYSRHQHVAVNISYAPSFEQTMAIQSGEPADVIISAHPKTFQQLQGTYDVNSVVSLVTSRMALVTSTDSPDHPGDITLDALRQMRKRSDFLLAVATPAAAAEGFYAEEILNHLRPKIFVSSQTVQLQNTSDIAEFLLRTPAFGILFESDALQARGVRQLALFPESWHEKATFTGAVIAGGNMEAAREFLKYLQSPEAQRKFLEYTLYPVKSGS